MLYQICYLNKDTTENGKTTLTLANTDLLTAADLRTAYATANATLPADDDADDDTDTTLRIYPYATPTDGESIMELSRRVVREYEKWELRNNNAVLEPARRTAEDREDLTSVASLAIVSVFAERPAVDMFTLSRLAFSAVATEQKRRDRNSEREYHPDYHADPLKVLVVKATCPALDRLLRKAVETADLTESQMDILTLSYADRTSAQDIADMRGVTRAAVYKTLYKAYYKVLEKAVEIDTDLRTFRKAGYTAEDVEEVLATLKKRTRK